MNSLTSIACTAARSDTGAGYETHYVRLADVDDSLIDEWRHLEQRSIESNAFLSPSFFVPAANYLMLVDRVVLVCVKTDAGELVGLGCFEHMPATRQVPFPHLRAFRTKHSFRSGLLVDPRHIFPALDGILNRLADDGFWGIEFGEQWLDSPLVQAIRIICDTSKYHWAEAIVYERPTVVPAMVCDAYLQENWSRNRRKSIRRNIGELERLGPVTFRLVDRSGDFRDAIERFLWLENAGWKGTAGTSLLSDASEAAFFRAMMNGFAESNAAFFVELLCDERVVGSTANFRSGATVSAFKVGWDPEFAAASPGKILDAELMRRAAQWLPGTSMIDSCAKGDSYLGQLWPERIRIGNGLLTLKRRSRLVADVLDQGRRAKRSLQRSLASPAEAT